MSIAISKYDLENKIYFVGRNSKSQSQLHVMVKKFSATLIIGEKLPYFLN